MFYGIFLITTDDDGNEHVGRMVDYVYGHSAANRFIEERYRAGQLDDGTEVPINGLKGLELEARPWGENPPRIKPGQIV